MLTCLSVLSAPTVTLMAWVMLACTANAQDDPSVRIVGAETRLEVYSLNADLEYALGSEPLEALANGVPIVFELQIEVREPRRLLPDATLASLRQRYRFKFLSLTQRYLVTNLNTNERNSFRSREEALEFLGHIRDLPILDRALLDPREAYLVRMRVILDIESLPAPLRLLAYLSSQWRISSEWAEWSL